MRSMILIGLLLVLGACSPTRAIVNQSEIIVIEPPENLMVCHQVRIPDDVSTYTNQQVAELIERLYRNNRLCGINMEQIREFVRVARDSINN